MISKKDRYIALLNPLFKIYKESNDDDELIKFLIKHSNLPGRRANLELASAFVSIIKKHNKSSIFFNLCKSFLQFDSQKAPTNDPQEFIPFCGIWGVGCFDYDSQLFPEILELISNTAHDSRWRIREAVAKSIHCLINQNSQILDIFSTWIKGKEWLVFRAIAAGVADPSVLINTKISKKALDLHKAIFLQITSSTDYEELHSEEFKALQKGLSYTLSVVVEKFPEEGFIFMKNLIVENS